MEEGGDSIKNINSKSRVRRSNKRENEGSENYMIFLPSSLDDIFDLKLYKHQVSKDAGSGSTSLSGSIGHSNFYASMVPCKSYEERSYFSRKMYGPYAFINVDGGKEEEIIDDDENNNSLRNMVEVAVAMKLLHKLYKHWYGSGRSLSIVLTSPYAAQVAAMQEKVRPKYENIHRFSVKVKSLDAFHGGNQDIVIFSAVRANDHGSTGFLSSPKTTTDVALTRARYCLWILVNERTFSKRESIWKTLILDAIDRQCFFDAHDDSDLSKCILHVKKELDELDDIVSGGSILFQKGIWKVMFSGDFRTSFSKLTSVHKKSFVITLLLKIASGWRPKRKSVESVCEGSSMVVKTFKVEGLYVICSNDIVKDINYKQVIKVWDVLPSLYDVSKLTTRLGSIFAMYTDDFIKHCKAKCLDGELEVPMTWPGSLILIRYKNANTTTIDGKSHTESSSVSESLLLMKFYSLSSGVVNYMLNSNEDAAGEMDLPFELTNEEQEVVEFPKSSFILGRSGTGKTTVLTMKILQKEQRMHNVAVSAGGINASDEEKEEEIIVLRQLFVTVSPKLCHAVKHHVSRLKNFICGGKNLPAPSSFDDELDNFKDIPDSFANIPPEKYPLVITFQKFLMMLDETLGDSYFERFHEITVSLQNNKRSNKSVALQSFIRMKEVNFDRFYLSYWPHFNVKMTKNLDPSRVFTEIISHIKGGWQAGDASDGKLSQEAYISMSSSRVSTLSVDERHNIYDIYLNYEKIKMMRGEFDLADFVNNLHVRLKSEGFKCAKMDFVYIDEVQDLTMRQISLFKYMCQNADEGFVFSGDTAQTIARGVDFRFEDIRNLFYREFLTKDDNHSRKEKGHGVSEMFNLCQNFRTHAGILGLAQSVIDLLCHFFQQSVDKLSPETSLIYGEAPVILEAGSDANAMMQIFGNAENGGGKIVGFGAEQVILVRDDSARKEISDYVGSNALVLPILECKGLEFQDVLLYNFFSSSPFKNQWRVIYNYMNKMNLLDPSLSGCFPCFSHEKHCVMCSELKQLYVAITRTRQRLWICENQEESSNPIFDYWKKLCLVQVKKVDDAFAKVWQRASSTAEWISRGEKLYGQKNYEMATLCFEKAKDTHWKKRSKASALRATADNMRTSNSREACSLLREAAEIFKSIGQVETAIECLFDSGEFEAAGRIYLEKFELIKAGECFTLAKCYREAAEAYDKANYFSDCLSVCKAGKLFDLGLQYIKSWEKRSHLYVSATQMDVLKQDYLESCARYYVAKDRNMMMTFVRAFCSMDSRRYFLKNKGCLKELLLLEKESGNFKEAADIAFQIGDVELEADLLDKGNYFSDCLSACKAGKRFDLGLQYIKSWEKRSHQYVSATQMDELKQDYLESCARYYVARDRNMMMTFVRDFCSMDSRRYFLKNKGCLDELLLLEEESGNFKEAADIAFQKGDVLLEAGLLDKAGLPKEASILIISYVMSNSMWAYGSNGLSSMHRKEILEKAQSFAKHDSDQLHELVCKEAMVLSGEPLELHILHQCLSYSVNHQCLRLELLSLMKILDFHFHTEVAKFACDTEIPDDLKDYSEDQISQGQVSGRTLIHFWNLWSQSLLNVIKYLECIKTQPVTEHTNIDEFCLNYFGVRRLVNSLEVTYALLNPHAHWVKNAHSIFVGKVIDACLFSLAARSHCCTKIISVGLRVLKTLKSICDLSKTNLLSSGIISVGLRVLETLQLYHDLLKAISLSSFSQCLCLIDIYKVTLLLKGSFESNENAKRKLQIFLRLLSTSYIQKVLPLDCRGLLAKNMISHRETDASRNRLIEVIDQNIGGKSILTYGQIGKVAMVLLGFGKPTFELCNKIAERLDGNLKWKTFFSTLGKKLASNESGEFQEQTSLVEDFHNALTDTYNANWRTYDYMSPHCYLYLVERLLIMVGHSSDCFYTTKYSFVEWIINMQSGAYPIATSVADMCSHVDIIFDSLSMMIRQFLYRRWDTRQWICKSNVIEYHSILVQRMVIILGLLCLNTKKYLDVLLNIVDGIGMSHLPDHFIKAIRHGINVHDADININMIAGAFRSVGFPLVIVSLGENSPKDACPDAISVDVGITTQRDDILGILFPSNKLSSVCQVTTSKDIMPDLYDILATSEDDGDNHIGGNGVVNQQFQLGALDDLWQENYIQGDEAHGESSDHVKDDEGNKQFFQLGALDGKDMANVDDPWQEDYIQGVEAQEDHRESTPAVLSGSSDRVKDDEGNHGVCTSEASMEVRY